MQEKKNPPHRPEKEIDWAIVDQLLQHGSPATEVAPHFDMAAETFCDRVQKKFGKSFTAYSAEKRQKGLSKLRSKQMYKALNADGDTTMLIWLGKNYLGQRDRQEKEEDLPPQDAIVDKDNENMSLKAQLAKLTLEIEALKGKIDNQPEARQELPGSDTPL